MGKFPLFMLFLLLQDTAMKIFDLFAGFSVVKRDALLLTLIIVLTYTFIISIDLAETVTAKFAQYENLQLDELPFLLLLMAFGLTWFTYRRVRERDQEIVLRMQAEDKIMRLLTENKALTQHLIKVQEAERQQLAIDLHDDIGQYLLAIRLDASALNLSINNAPISTTVNLHARRILSNAQHIQEMTRTLMRRLRPAPTDTKGLFDSIQQLTHEWHQQHPHIELDSNIDRLSVVFTQQMSITIYRLIQETLTNISKYANATSVWITLTLQRNEAKRYIHLEIKDNGNGYASDTAQGMGMIGMRERVTSLMGEFNITSHVNHGVTVVAKIPLMSL